MGAKCLLMLLRYLFYFLDLYRTLFVGLLKGECYRYKWTEYFEAIPHPLGAPSLRMSKPYHLRFLTLSTPEIIFVKFWSKFKFSNFHRLYSVWVLVSSWQDSGSYCFNRVSNSQVMPSAFTKWTLKNYPLTD